MIQSYGSNQQENLKNAANKYDPTGVYQRRVGGFKLDVSP